MNFWEKFYKLCTEKGMSPNGVAKELGIASGSITAWKTDGTRKPQARMLQKIAEYFNVSVDYLMGKEDSPQINSFDIFSIPGIQPVKTKKLPILGSVACGEPIFADEQFEGYISADENLKADFCLYAKGDSMIGAGIEDGSIVFVRSQPTVEDGQIAVVLIEDEATLKRVYFDNENQQLILHPENRNYKPIIVRKNQIENGQVRILGRAVACQFKLR